ncbi:uncharacterized protein LOC144864894 [Branchiostoma floridae x Branchiostoma japonicum]
MSENNNATTSPATDHSEDTMEPLLDPADEKILKFSSVYMIGKHALLICFYTTLLFGAFYQPCPMQCAALWIVCILGVIHSISSIMYEVFMVWAFKDLQSLMEKSEKSGPR